MHAPETLTAKRPVRELTPVEQRRAKRQEVLTTAVLMHGRSGDSAPCTLRNISPLGARVRLKTPQFLSRPLYLIINRTGSAFEAKVIWSKAGELGLSLQRRLNLETPASEAEWAARKLWLRHRPKGHKPPGA